MQSVYSELINRDLTLVDHCDSSPCKNGGICKNVENSFECTCKQGYTGVICDKKGNKMFVGKLH